MLLTRKKGHRGRSGAWPMGGCLLVVRVTRLSVKVGQPQEVSSHKSEWNPEKTAPTVPASVYSKQRQS